MRSPSKLTRVIAAQWQHALIVLIITLLVLDNLDAFGLNLFSWSPLTNPESDAYNKISLEDAELLYASHSAVTKQENSADINGFRRWLAFATANGCSTNLTESYAQIYRDLEPWRETGISPKVAEDMKNQMFISMARIDRYGQLHLDNPKNPAVREIVGPVAHILKGSVKGKNLWIPVNILDEPRVVPADIQDATAPANYTGIDQVFQLSQCYRNTYPPEMRKIHGFFSGPDSFSMFRMAAPVFSQTKLTPCHWDFIFPRGHHLEVAIKPVVDPVPWKEKKAVLFWRGSTTGGSYRWGKPWTEYPRTRLIAWGLEYEQKHPGSTFDAGLIEHPIFQKKAINNTQLRVDVGFSSFSQYDATAAHRVYTTYGGLKQRVSFEQMLNFKYLIVLDGNTWPGRLQAYLATNSVILYNGIFTDFFNWRLVPMVHYVPVKLDYSDLEERLLWLMTHDEEARQIVENAQRLMKEVNRVQALQCYSGLLLMEYAALHGKTVQK
ncbi:F-actin-capping protein subunit alpha [Chytriomyces hyalinus]|nr:F-actin-capping protein subunit alpha [Chytriomyces hyalinus]